MKSLDILNIPVMSIVVVVVTLACSRPRVSGEQGDILPKAINATIPGTDAAITGQGQRQNGTRASSGVDSGIGPSLGTPRVESPRVDAVAGIVDLYVDGKGPEKFLELFAAKYRNLDEAIKISLEVAHIPAALRPVLTSVLRREEFPPGLTYGNLLSSQAAKFNNDLGRRNSEFVAAEKSRCDGADLLLGRRLLQVRTTSKSIGQLPWKTLFVEVGPGNGALVEANDRVQALLADERTSSVEDFLQHFESGVRSPCVGVRFVHGLLARYAAHQGGWELMKRSNDPWILYEMFAYAGPPHRLKGELKSMNARHFQSSDRYLRNVPTNFKEYKYSLWFFDDYFERQVLARFPPFVTARLAPCRYQPAAYVSALKSAARDRSKADFAKFAYFQVSAPGFENFDWIRPLDRDDIEFLHLASMYNVSLAVAGSPKCW